MRDYEILIAEDDESILHSIEIYLGNNDRYKTTGVSNGLDALEETKKKDYDLVIMDLMMPGMTGEDAIREIRRYSVVPILILSAKSEDLDKIMGLTLGADDYLTKPFNPMELLARVDAIIRRNHDYNSGEKDSEILIGDVKLLLDQRRVEVLGKSISLTPIEFQILALLMKNPGRVFSIEEIYEKIWKEPALDPKTVTVHIRRIREKIEVNPKHPRYIQVAWGLGYRFVNEKRSLENGKNQ